MGYHQNVFINCPFDQDYVPILDAVLYTLLSLGFEPQISQTRDSGSIRIKEIEKLILKSRYSIHDISRSVASTPGEIARFNMPFELGIDWGCKLFKGKQFRKKVFLILDEKKYRYQQALSDLAGCDPESHNKSPEEAVRIIRNWIYNNSAGKVKKSLAPANNLWLSYLGFRRDLQEQMNYRGYSETDISQMPRSEKIHLIKMYRKGL